MNTSKSHIEEMHARLEEISRREQILIQALDAALAEADRKLLDDVRTVAVEHEARRAVILTELESLAARIGALPVAAHEPEQLDYEELDLSNYSTLQEETSAIEAPKGGDWRTAAQNIGSDLNYGSASNDEQSDHEMEPPLQKRA